MAQAAEHRDRRKRALEIAAALLLLERRAITGLRAALTVPVIGFARTGNADRIAETMRGTGRAAIQRIRSAARHRSGAVWQDAAGLDVQTAGAALSDAFAADRAARALSQAWRKAVADAEAEEKARDAAIRSALADIDSRVKRTATTETASAFNDEVRARNAAAASLGYEVVETWEAALDRRTCPACAEMDGQMRARPDVFADYPPLHPLCRCFVSTDVIARAAA